MPTAPEPVVFTIPVSDPIVATATLLLVHKPPVIASLSVTVPGPHKYPMPVIAGIAGFAVTIVVAVPQVAVL